MQRLKVIDGAQVREVGRRVQSIIAELTFGGSAHRRRLRARADVARRESRLAARRRAQRPSADSHHEQPRHSKVARGVPHVLAQSAVDRFIQNAYDLVVEG